MAKTKDKTREKPKGSKMSQFLEAVKGADGQLLRDAYKDPTVEGKRLSSGFYTIDALLDGGLKQGTYIEMFGQESVGKTTLAIHMMAQCQKLWNRPVAFFDFEHTWSYERAQQLGVDVSKDMFGLWEPPSQEDGYDLIDIALKYRDKENKLPPYGLIVVDSLSSMPVLYETDNKMEKQSMAYQARNNSKAFRKITSALGDVIVIFINQVRDNMSLYGGPTVTSGGRAVKHYMHHRLELRKETVVEEIEEWNEESYSYETIKARVGHMVRFHLHKNKIGRPERKAKVLFSYDLGHFDPVEDIKQFLGPRGFIWRDGPQFWGVKGHDKKIRGKKGIYNFVRDNPELMDALVKEAQAL